MTDKLYIWVRPLTCLNPILNPISFYCESHSIVNPFLLSFTGSKHPFYISLLLTFVLFPIHVISQCFPWMLPAAPSVAPTFSPTTKGPTKAPTKSPTTKSPTSLAPTQTSTVRYSVQSEVSFPTLDYYSFDSDTLAKFVLSFKTQMAIVAGVDTSAVRVIRCVCMMRTNVINTRCQA